MGPRTRTELATALTTTSFTAQRDFPVVGTPECPTPGDLHHRQIDDMLTLLEYADQALETECA